ncbi:MAG: hypothetical protein LBU27_06115 [Candidatus Peribacteria bacterium]|jgi:hypothetical protein|nr:hypothetical protein [Candidatus Peribacteria bacterium]
MPRIHSQNRSPNETISSKRLQDINLDLDDIFAVLDPRSIQPTRDEQKRLTKLEDSLGNVINFDRSDFEEDNLLYIQRIGDTKKYAVTYDGDGMVIDVNYA